MPFQFVILWTDALLYLLVVVIILFAIYVYRHEHLRAPWRQVAQRRLGMAAAVVLIFCICIGLLDSIHFRVAIPQQNGIVVHYSTQVESLLDVLVSPLGKNTEKSYSSPFTIHAYSKSKGQYTKLRYAGTQLKNPSERGLDIFLTSLFAISKALALWLLITGGITLTIAKRQQLTWKKLYLMVLKGQTRVAWREIILTLGAIFLISFLALDLAANYHIFGTDKVGNDVFYESIKSIRTGLIIGTLTTLVMLPFAVLLGTAAGYFGGFVDDVIQYIYTTLSSVPAVLLITATILALQVFITNHPDLFPTLAVRADARLLALCVILGITNWTNLCRLIRGETLKIREMDYVQASVALGVRKPKIISRHVLPNVMHIILITIVLDFSILVLAEAVLSYVGVGVDPTTQSWGNMINSARLELAREPIVWWPLLAAFITMFILILSANFFADAVRDAFDPKLRNIQL